MGVFSVDKNAANRERQQVTGVMDNWARLEGRWEQMRASHRAPSLDTELWHAASIGCLLYLTFRTHLPFVGSSGTRSQLLQPSGRSAKILSLCGFLVAKRVTAEKIKFLQQR